MSLRIAALLLTAAMTTTSAFGAKQTAAQACEVELIVLGVGQDAGAPQIGNNDDAAWSDDSLTLWPASIAVIDYANSARFLFEATPAITGQLQLLHTLVGPHDAPLGLDGVFLTHAHIGHYAGLLYAGHEAAGAKKLNVYAMPRMREFLENNAPWSQLVSFENITLHSLSDQTPQLLTKTVSVTPLLVPHRDEFSETVGYIITAGGKRVLFLPDINSWDDWRKQEGTDIGKLLATLDYAFIDATFYDNNELPGRDMSQFPHPRIAKMMDRFDALPAAERAKVRFIHLNHSNPARYKNSAQYAQIQQRGYQVATRGERICLSGQTQTATKIACSPAGFDHEQLTQLKKAEFQIDDDERRNAFARELTSCLAHPDPVLRATQRGVLTDDQWQALFASLTAGENAEWPQDAYASNAALAKLHNTRAFLQSLYTSVAEVSAPEFRAFKSIVQETLRTLP